MTNGIGGAGGSGKVPNIPEAPGANRSVGSPGASFAESLGETHASRSSGATGVAAAEPSLLEKLRAGKIDAATYIEGHVEAAVEHLKPLLPPADLEVIRAELRDVLQHDPEIAGLVRTATSG